MNVYVNRDEEDNGYGICYDLYRGKYPEPSQQELLLIHPFLYKFELEDDNFVEEEDPRWISHLGSPPNLRSLLIKFLIQLRATKGYEVDTYFDLWVVPRWKWLPIFIPHNLADRKFYCLAMDASNFAIHSINLHTGKNYKVVSVDKLVTTTRYGMGLLLLTFTANEIATAHSEIFQAMLSAATDTFQLREWKFKPIPYYQL